MEKLGKAIEILKNLVFIAVVVALLLNAFGKANIEADCPRCMPIFEKLLGLSDANAAPQIIPASYQITPQITPPTKLFTFRYSLLPYEPS